MIPKIIHYCWFGHTEKSELIEKCINSWSVYFPGWEIIEWNEDNYDVNKSSYTKEAYEEKKYAFVSDVVRLEVIYTYGGIYLDTDVEIFEYNPLEKYLDKKMILCFENERAINTGILFGAELYAENIGRLLSDYQNRHFRLNDGFDLTVNTKRNEPIIKEMFPELEWNNENQIICDTVFLSSVSFGAFGKHYGCRSWDPAQKEFLKHKPKDKFYYKIIRNPKIFKALAKYPAISRIYEWMTYDLLDNGPIYFAKRILKKK